MLTQDINIQNILKKLEFNDETFPRTALADAIANRDQIIPDLLEIIKQAKENAEKLVDQGAYFAHIYAMYLLAQFREKSAYPLIVDFFSLPGKISLDIIGDVATEFLGNILASVSCGDTSLMKKLAEDKNIHEYVRCAAVEGFLTLVVCGEKSRDEVMSYYQSLFRGKLEREYSFVWTKLVICSAYLYPEEVFEDIRQVYKEDLIESFFIRFEDVKEYLARGKEKVLADLQRDDRYSLIEDTISEMEWWACFKPSKQPYIVTPVPKAVKKKIKKRIKSRISQPDYDAPPEMKKEKKIGRNEPCPCGSGKKYKKCCGANL